MATAETVNPNYQLISNDTGRVFRVGETDRQILGHSRVVVIISAWVAMMLAGLLEYTWGALNGSLSAAHNWSTGEVYWAFSFFVVFESFVQIFTGFARNRGLVTPRTATIAGGIICGVVGYGVLASTSNIWVAYLGYAVLGGIGSGMVYSSCINIVAKWYPDRKGWRTGFVNGGWAYGAVPFILVIGGFNTGGGVGTMSASQVKTYIWTQAIIMTVVIGVAGFFLKDPPKNWWPKEIDPLNWHKHSTRDLESNPPSLRHYSLGQMWRTKSAKWVGIQYALYVGCSLFGVAYYVPFAQAKGLGMVGLVGFAGFALTDGGFRPIYGKISEYIGRRRTMIYAYLGNVVFQLLALAAGSAHNAPLFATCAVISGGLSGANFPMTAALVADYWGETNNAVNYGSIYAWKAVGGSFAGGLAAWVITGTVLNTGEPTHWIAGFFFGAGLGLLAALTLIFMVHRPTEEEMAAAVAKSPDKTEATKPVAA
jgi:MFS transporter, OFA family, oxalate/formate antiporter